MFNQFLTLRKFGLFHMQCRTGYLRQAPKQLIVDSTVFL